MSDTAQQQIDILIQSIADAEEPASITNGMVATVLEFLADRIKKAFAAQAGFLDSSDLAAALETYFVDGELRNNVLPTALVSIIASLPENYTRLGRDGKLLSSQAPAMVLASMGSSYDPPGYRYEPKNGDTYFLGSKLMYVKDEESLDMGSPSAGTVYCNAANDTLYRWNGSRFVTVSSPNSGTTSNLTAIINNIETVNSKLNALIEALANIAFKQLPKPQTSELDWDGTKHTVKLNTNGMSGCSVEGNWPKQILDGMSAVITVVPENGKILRSVTYRYGNDYTWQTVVISNNQAVIAIPNVTSDITVTITASATDAGSFTATINDSRVDGTGATSGITEGSSWTSVLSLNGADPSDEITNVTVEMTGGGSISAEVVSGVWTVHTDYVTGNITITATVAGVTRHSVTMGGDTSMYTHNAPSNGAVDGEDLVVVLTPALYCSIESIAITMGGDPLIENTDYDVVDSGGVKTVTIYNVNGDVVISASATNVNTAFKNVVCWKQAVAPARSIRYGNNYDYITSPLVDISDCTNVTFNSGETIMALFLYDSNRNYRTFFNGQSGGRTVDVTNYSYARISCKTADKDSAFIKDANSNDVLWSGSEITDASLLPGAKDWEDSTFSIQPNENGDYIGRAFANDAGNIVVSGTNVVDSIDGTSPNPFSLGKKIRLPKDGTEGTSNITFGTGGTKNNSGGLAFYDENGNRTNSGYYTFNANPRTVEVGAQYFECVFMFPTDDYETAYIINANTGELLWGTAPTETNE